MQSSTHHGTVLLQVKVILAPEEVRVGECRCWVEGTTQYGAPEKLAVKTHPDECFAVIFEKIDQVTNEFLAKAAKDQVDAVNAQMRGLSNTSMKVTMKVKNVSFEGQNIDPAFQVSSVLKESEKVIQVTVQSFQQVVHSAPCCIIL